MEGGECKGLESDDESAQDQWNRVWRQQKELFLSSMRCSACPVEWLVELKV